jgi:thymidylate synthase (FAD)
MRIVPAGFEIEGELDGIELLSRIERAGRTCYKSEGREFTAETAKKFVKMLIDRGHHSVLEHTIITVRFTIDRGVSHECVRHRIASFSQESTRYCNYSKDKFGSEITVIDIRPFLSNPESVEEWLAAMADAEKHYFRLIELGNKPEIARSVLPNSLKTELVMTANAREWRHFFSLRAATPAHPQMREVACTLLKYLRKQVPVLFDDVGDVNV